MTNSRMFVSSLSRRISIWVLAVIALAWLVARFVHLGGTPPGFWMDEAWDAVHALCLAETGRDGNGRPWPLFSNALGGGTLPITWTVFNVGWTRIFGTSIAGFRSAAAFWNVITGLGLFGIARSVRGLYAGFAPAAATDSDSDQGALRAFPLLVILAACLSPWSFQFSRIAWEGPMAPAFLVVALWALINLRRSPAAARVWPLWTTATGAGAALSMISYPPLRVTVPLAMAAAAALMIWSLPRGRARTAFVLRLAPGVVVFALLIAPVVLLTIRGEIVSRTMGVAIFAPDWLDKHRGIHGRLAFFLVTLVDNIFVHLRPSYLFVSGDANPRHSAQLVGQLSPIDSFALVLALAATVRLLGLAARQVTGSDAVNWPRMGKGAVLLVIISGFAVVAGFAATLPAALTWESVPHSLRSIGAWPFVSLFAGAVLALAWSRISWLPIALAAVALIHSAWYLPGYFGRAYHDIDPNVFHRDITEAIDAGHAGTPRRTARESIAPLVPRYIDEILRYFLMRYDGLSCQASADTLHDMRRPP